MGKPAKSGVLRQTVVKPLGFMTTPNPYGQFPAGALRDAKNVVLRRPGEIMAAPSSTNYTQFESSIYTARQLVPMDSGHTLLLSQSNVDNWILDEAIPGGTVNAGAFPVGSPSINGLFSASRVTSTRSRDRVLLNTKTGGVFATDFMAPSSLAQRTLRFAGLPQPYFGTNGINTSTGSAIPQNVMVSYRAVFVREFSDGYVLRSMPSPPLKYLSTTVGNASITFFISWGIVIAVGDYVELYRTDGLSTTSINADPGGTFKLINRVKLTATDITNFFVNITDNQVLLSPFYTTYGRELYTNPYQEGENNANLLPECCNAMATFKGFTFYGNLVDRAQFELSVPGGFNESSLMLSGVARRATGVGTRFLTGTVTSGSPNITGVSAAEMIGIVVGQNVLGAFVFGTKVLSVGATSFVATTNATASSAGPNNVQTVDVIEVDGALIDAASAQGITQNLAAQSGKLVATNQATSLNFGADAAGLIIAFEPAFPSSTRTITLRATNGANYAPPLPTISATVLTLSPTPRLNLLRWSKDSEPEHIPSVNETFVGSGQIIALATTKDALWIGCTDGVYRLSGDAGVWRVDLVAPGLVLCSPRCMVNMRETIYAYTNFGFGAITDSGFIPISHNLVRSSFPGPPFAETADMLLGRNDAEGEVLFSSSAASSATAIFVYNTISKQFSYINAPTQHFNQVTAFAWQENPASGSQCTLWGISETGQAPGFMCWNSTAAYLDVRVEFYPIDAGDPVSTKQWIDISYLFLEEAAGYLCQAFMSDAGTYTFYAQATIARHTDADALATVGIPRQWALGPVLRPGFQVASIGSNRVFCLGISMRYVPLSLQREVRQ